MSTAGAVSCWVEACIKKKGSQLLHLCCHPGILTQSIASDSVALDSVGSAAPRRTYPKGEREWLCMSCKSYLHVKSWISSIIWRWREWEKDCGCCFWLELVTCIWNYILRHFPASGTPSCPLLACLCTAVLSNTESFQCFMFLIPFEVSSGLESQGVFIMDVGVVSLFVFLFFFLSQGQTQNAIER